MTNICLGRQAIYDRDLKVLGYRILGFSETAATVTASARDLVASLISFGTEKVVGTTTTFIPVPVGELSQAAEFLPKERFVIEVGADLTANPSAVADIQTLAKSGYTVALRDVSFAPALEDAFKAAKFVQYDSASMDKGKLTKLLTDLHAKQVKVSVYNVQNHQAYHEYRDLGVDCFQGQFVCEPDLNDDKELKASRLGSMRLLSKLQEPDLDLPDLETIIEQDVTLSYKLLRYLNSAFFALPSKIESIKRALLMLGLRPVRNWASMIVLAGFDDKPQELIITAMLRAKFCELLARAQGIKAADGFFTVGLLSTLDAFLNKPLEEALQLVPLSEEVKAAILKNEGRMGEILATVKDYERGKASKIPVPAGQEPVAMSDVFLEAVAWVTECSAEIIVSNMSRRAA